MLSRSRIQSPAYRGVHRIVKLWWLFCMSVAAATALAQTKDSPADLLLNEQSMAAGAPASPFSQSDPKAVIEKIKAESPNTREWTLEKSSEAYEEDHGNPALKLEKMWGNDKGTVLRLSGLPRNRSPYSAVLDIQSLRLFNLNSKKYSKYIVHMGGVELTGQGRNAGDAATKMVQLKPGESLYVFFEPIEDIDPHSLRYKNWLGGEDSYFDKIDPRFTERYDQLYAKASRKDAQIADVKDFLLQFARNDPNSRVKPVFINLIQRLHSQGTFDGYYQSYLLIKDPADAAAAKAKASTPEQQSKIAAAVAEEQRKQDARQDEIRQAKEAQLAERRRRDEARAADLRKQEEAQQAENKQRLAKEDEERCLRTPSCRRAWEEEQERCNQSIMACRGNCDRITGNGNQRSFFGGFAAAALARACYSACKCGSGFGDLLAKANGVLSEQRASSASNAAPSAKSSASRSSSASTLKTFECKVYCKSASGPVTYHTVNTASRGEAAKYMGEHADEICLSKGMKYASSIAFPESQCREQ